jgi:3-hydroxybutyryl-CoA dehydratase
VTPQSVEVATLEFAELAVGMSVEEDIVLTDDDLEHFRHLTGDNAPVHHDDEFARAVGMAGRIVYGLLVAAPFSRLLGCRLPGALSVIHSLRVDFALPVRPGDPLRYSVAISQVSPATKVVLLDLSVFDRTDSTRQILRGRAQCGLAR